MESTDDESILSSEKAESAFCLFNIWPLGVDCLGSIVAARFVTTNLMHCLHILSLWHVLSLGGDKTCWKVHSLHVLSPLCQQHYNLSFPSLIVCACVCVCVLMVHLSIAPHAPACVLLCLVFIIPASISTKLKFCIALCIYRLWGYCCP